MNSVTAGDIAVGQLWREMLTDRQKRLIWRVVEMGDGHVLLQWPPRAFTNDLKDVVVREVSFGTLLAHWILLGSE